MVVTDERKARARQVREGATRHLRKAVTMYLALGGKLREMDGHVWPIGHGKAPPSLPANLEPDVIRADTHE